MIACDYTDNKGLPFLIHASWNGITIADFVFPAFLFIMGTAIPFAVNKKIPIRFKNILRIFMLYFIGFALNCIKQKFQFY
jgi:predicted acyltransferase